MTRTLLIAIGNPLRGDDGVAHRVLELLVPMSNVATQSVLQPTPELAVEIAEADRVIFIDADPSAGAPHLEPLHPGPQTRAAFGHAITPAEVVNVARKLYNFSGQAHLCAVPGRDFSEGEFLTPDAEAAAQEAAHLLRGACGAEPCSAK